MILTQIVAASVILLVAQVSAALSGIGFSLTLDYGLVCSGPIVCGKDDYVIRLLAFTSQKAPLSTL